MENWEELGWLHGRQARNLVRSILINACLVIHVLGDNITHRTPPAIINNDGSEARDTLNITLAHEALDLSRNTLSAEATHHQQMENDLRHKTLGGSHLKNMVFGIFFWGILLRRKWFYTLEKGNRGDIIG